MPAKKNDDKKRRATIDQLKDNLANPDIPPVMKGQSARLLKDALKRQENNSD
jgi:hypothetical protein